MNGATADLELLALARLGLARTLPGALPPGTSVLEALAGRGLLASADVARVKSYLAQNSISCACGEQALPSANDLAFSCPVCQRLFYRRSAGVWQPAKATPPPTVGSRIGPLELTKVLGKGAQGIVFLARHVQFQRSSAVKILPSATLDDHKRRRFAREVEALARLNHPSIVKIHATFEVEGSLACEMELVSGETLEERIDKTGPLPWRQAVALTAKLARATAHAHQAGVLHRDLKPANVLLREGSGEPLLADFGLSRLTDLASSLTVAGAQLGTPFYMAPEAFSGDSSERTDVYGLGTILYQCLTGLPPFRETQLAALYHKASKGLCEPTHAPDAPPGVEDVRRTAMAPEPEARYATAEALALDLEALLAGRAPSASSTVGLAATARARGRSRLLVAGAAVAVVAVGLAGTFFLGSGRRHAGPLEADLETSAGAIDFLEHESGAGHPELCAHALQTLNGVMHGSQTLQQTLRRDLDSAISHAPSALELRRARALADRARGHWSRPRTWPPSAAWPPLARRPSRSTSTRSPTTRPPSGSRATTRSRRLAPSSSRTATRAGPRSSSPSSEQGAAIRPCARPSCKRSGRRARRSPARSGSSTRSRTSTGSASSCPTRRPATGPTRSPSSAASRTRCRTSPASPG